MIPDKFPSECFDFIVYSISNFSVDELINKAGPNHFFSLALSEPMENSNSQSVIGIAIYFDIYRP